MSFQIAIPKNRKSAARFVGRVRRSLVRMIADEPEVSQSQIADAIGVHRSVISRQLKGQADMNIGRVAEIAWAAGYRPSFGLEKVEAVDGANWVPPVVKIAETAAYSDAATVSLPAEVGAEAVAQDVNPRVLVKVQ